jgi:hypothetical protein
MQPFCVVKVVVSLLSSRTIMSKNFSRGRIILTQLGVVDPGSTGWTPSW